METTFYKYLQKYNIPLFNIDIFKESISYELLTKHQAKNRCIKNVSAFINKYPEILSILPDTIMSSTKIKCFLSCNYNDVYFDKDIFLNVWMEYFYWKLNYSKPESPQR